jgi:hypothetical protein
MIFKMAMDDILKLSSVDSVVYGKEDRVTVGEILELVDINGEYYQKLKKQMAKDGINNIPILSICGELNNGHHRTKIARDLGWSEMNATDTSREQTWAKEIVDSDYSLR